MSVLATIQAVRDQLNTDIVTNGNEDITGALLNQNLIDFLDTVEAKLVASFEGRVGIVTAATNDYTWAQIDKTLSDIADLADRSHTDLTDIGTKTHPQIDTHIANNTNPHGTDLENIGSGTLSELNAAITDETLSGSNTGDMTNLSVKTAYEANLDTNAFTDSEKTIVGNTSNTNTGDMSDADVKTAYENNSDTNAFTDSDVIVVGNTSNTNTGDNIQATTSQIGIQENATTAEVTTGTATDRTITPDSLKEASIMLDNLELTGQGWSATNTLTDAVTIVTDCNNGNVHRVTLGGNRTLGAPTNLKDGATYIWEIKQDVTGTRTLAYNSVFKFPGGTAPTLSTGSGDIDILTGVSNGTNVNCVMQNNFS